MSKTRALLVCACALLLFAAVEPGRCDVTNGLVVHYSFDDWNAGSLIDRSGNGRDASVNGALWTGDGAVGGAYCFDGVDDVVDLSSHASALNLSSGSLCLWFRMTNNTSSIISLGRDTDYLEGGSLSIGSATGSITNESIYFKAPSYRLLEMYNARGHSYYHDGRWHQLVIVCDGVQNRIYVDGAREATLFAWGSATTSGQFLSRSGMNRFLLGQFFGTPDYFFTGSVDDFRVYGRALDDSDVQELYEMRDPSLVLHYTFDSDDGGRVIDQSGNGYTGSVYGATWSPGGVSGGAYSFDGVDDFINLSRLSAHEFPRTASVALWAKWTDPVSGTNGPILLSGVAVDDRPCFVLKAAAGGGIDGDNQSGNDMGAGLDDGQWHHIVAVYDDRNQHVTTYVDGVLVGREFRSDGQCLDLNAAKYSIGHRWVDGPIGSQFWKGMIDDVRIYDRALSAVAVSALYKGSIGLPLTVKGDPWDIGSPLPPGYGTAFYKAGESVTNIIPTPFKVGSGSRWHCQGWVGTGSVPASGGSNRVSFVMGTNSTITWLWKPEYYLDLTTSEYGGVTAVSGWHTNNSTVVLSATNQPAGTFLQWTGDVPEGHEHDNPLTVTMGQGRKIKANFTPGLDVGLTIYYNFDQWDGVTVLDQSGNGKHGSVSGPVAITEGVTNGAYHFDGVDDRIVALDSLDPSAYTLSVWVKLDESAARNILVRTTSSGPQSFYSHQLQTDEFSRFHHYVYPGSFPAGNLFDSLGAALGNWYHVVGTAIGSGAMKLYVNGREVASVNPLVGALWTTGDQWWIGSSANSRVHFKGAMDELKIYSRALCPGEVLQLYGRGAHAVVYNQLSIQGAPEPHGQCSPFDYGVNTVVSNSVLTHTVPEVADETATSRWVCMGWTGTGSVPSDGGSNSVSFTITADSTLTWQWQQQFRLEVAAGAGGSIGPVGDWHDAGASVELAASPTNGCHFAYWSGDVPAGHETDNPLSLTMNQARHLIAVFEPDTYALSGKTYYWGSQTGPVTIEAYDAAQGGARVASVTTSQPGPFTLGGLPANRDYWISAYLDDDEDGLRDSWEPMGEFSGNPVANISGPVTGINIQLGRLNPPANVRAAGAVDSIVVSWDPGLDTGVDGYNVYRFDPNWGQFDLMNNAPLHALRYLDASAASGVKYWYFVTSVGYSGLLGSFMQSPASDLVWAMWGQVRLWMPDYNADTGHIARLRINLDDAEGVLGNELAIRVTFDPSILTPYTPGTVEKTAITRDMTISTILGSNTVSIVANAPVEDHVTLKILGCAYGNGPNHPIPIKARYSLNAGTDWTAINGYQDVNNGRSYSADLGTAVETTNVVLHVMETDSGRQRRSDDGSAFVKAYRNGEKIEDVPGIYGQESLKQYLAGLVDSNLIVRIGANDVIYLFELSTATNGPAADFQDVVALMEYNKGGCLKGSGHLFDVLFQVTNTVPRGTVTTNRIEYALLKNQSGDTLDVDIADEAVLTLTNAFVLGDLNGDGEVTVNEDFTLAMKIAVGHLTATAYQLLAGDIDGDGRITKTDATLIHRIAKGLPINADGTVPPAGGAGLLDDPIGLAGEGYHVSLGSAEGQPSGAVRVGVVLDKTAGVASVGVRVSFNAYLLELVGVTNGPLAGTEWGLEYRAGDGYVDIAISAPEALATVDGVVAYIEFLVKPGSEIGTMSALSITRSELGGETGGDLALETGVGSSAGTVWVVFGAGDSDGDGLTDYEEQAYDGSLLYDPYGSDLDATNPDTDGDGMKDGAEVRAHTDPLSDGSLLEVTRLELGGSGLTIEWRGGTTGTQYLERASSLSAGAVWVPIWTNLPSAATNHFDDFTPAGDKGFYRIRVP